MKFSLAVLALIGTLAAAGKGKGEKKGKGKSDETLPEGAEDDWRDQYDITDDCEPIFQTIESGADSFFINGDEIETSDLTPMDTLFSEGAMVTIGGVTQTPKIYIYQSEAHPGVRVVVDDDMNVVSASMDRDNGHLLSLVQVVGSEFAEYDSETCLDDSKYEGYLAGDVEAPGINRALRGVSAMKRNLQMAVSPPNTDGDCAVLAKTTMFIIATSEFSTQVTLIQDIFAATKAIYLNDACIDISLSGVFIADPTNDPYQQMKDDAIGICINDSNSLERKFRDYLNDPANSPPDGNAATTHLFYTGSVDNTNTIGCAFIGEICNTFGVGVNQINFARNLVRNRNLLAHENGHNYDANHDETTPTENIMEPSLNQANQFSAFSVDEMQNCVNGGGCTNSCVEFVLPPATTEPTVTEPTTTDATTEPTTTEPTTTEPTTTDATTTDATTTDPTEPTVTLPTDITVPTDPTTATTLPTTTTSATTLPTTTTSATTPATTADNTCLAYTPKDCKATERKVKRCCATAEFDCDGAPKLLCTGREEKASKSSKKGNDGDEDEEDVPDGDEDEEDSNFICEPMAESCDNKVKKFKNCCATKTLQCPGKSKKGSKKDDEPSWKDKEICVGVLV